MKRSSFHRRTLAFLAVIIPLLALLSYIALGPIDNVALLPTLAWAANSEARQHALELLRALNVERPTAAPPSLLSGAGRQLATVLRCRLADCLVTRRTNRLRHRVARGPPCGLGCGRFGPAFRGCHHCYRTRPKDHSDPQIASITFAME